MHFRGNNLFFHKRGHKEAKVPSCTHTCTCCLLDIWEASFSSDGFVMPVRVLVHSNLIKPPSPREQFFQPSYNMLSWGNHSFLASCYCRGNECHSHWEKVMVVAGVWVKAPLWLQPKLPSTEAGKPLTWSERTSPALLELSSALREWQRGSWRTRADGMVPVRGF